MTLRVMTTCFKMSGQHPHFQSAGSCDQPLPTSQAMRTKSATMLSLHALDFPAQTDLSLLSAIQSRCYHGFLPFSSTTHFSCSLYVGQSGNQSSLCSTRTYNFPAPFVKMTTLASWECPCAFVENQQAVCFLLYFWPLSPFAMTFLFICALVTYSYLVWINREPQVSVNS